MLVEALVALRKSMLRLCAWDPVCLQAIYCDDGTVDREQRQLAAHRPIQERGSRYSRVGIRMAQGSFVYPFVLTLCAGYSAPPLCRT